MSILNRLNRIIRSNVSDLRASDASDGLDKALGEMESSLKDARRQKIELRKQEKKLIAAIRRHRDKADRWENRAMLALERDQEDLAREALIVRNEALSEAANLRDELQEHRTYLQDIDSALDALEMKIDGARGRANASGSPSSRRRTLGDERGWDAEFRRRVNRRGADGDSADRRRTPPGAAGGTSSANTSPNSPNTSSTLGGDRLFDEVDRMGDKIDAYEAEVEAAQELSGDRFADPDRQRLEQQFRRLEDRGHDADRSTAENDDDDGSRRPTRGDDDLADLKKKFED